MTPHDRPWTPGPWKIEQSAIRNLWYLISEKDDEVIGEFAESGVDVDRLPGKANARLAAASPALFEALADLVERVKDTVHVIDIDPAKMGPTDVTKALAALVLARGEQEDTTNAR